MIRPEFRENLLESDKLFVHAAKIGGWCAQAAALFLLTRAELIGGLSPFAPACLAAGMTGGLNPFCMMAGCAAGALSAGRGELEWIRLISCALVCALLTGTRLLENRFVRLREQRDFLCGLSAGAGMLAAGMIFSGGIPYNMLTCALSSAFSMFLAPALVSGMTVRLNRKKLMPEEQLSVSLLLLLLLIGLRAVPYAGKALAQCAAVWTVLLFSGAGAGMGALAGIAAGTALTLSGSDPFMGSALGLCGLLAGCAAKLPRIGAGLSFFIGNLLTVSWGVGYTTGAAETGPLLAGCIFYCLMPAGAVQRLQGWMQTGCPQADPENIAVRMRQKAGRRLGELSDVFGELADGYGEETALPGEQQIISSVRHALCDGCGSYAHCWMGDHSQAGRLMCRMAAEALSGKTITPARELPPDLLRHCRRSSQIDHRAVPLLSKLAKERTDALKRGEARGLIGRQFREAQKILDSLSTQLKGSACVNREYAPIVHAALDRAGICAQEITAVLDDRLEIVCVLKERIWDAASAQQAASLLSSELGIPFSPVLMRGQVPGECELRLRQAPALTASFASVSCAVQDGGECGDSHLTLLLPDGRLIAALSDGMGHGKQAASESRRCISLLRKFVSAGIDRDAALSAVNTLLMMRSAEEMFATADLCVVDLYSGMASWSKLGACSSYVVSEKGVRPVAGGRLPLGIIDQVEPATERLEVHPGDLILMISDGIADEMKDGQTASLRSMLPGVRHMKPAQAAQAVLDWARSRDDGKEKDDMTVIAIRVLARKIRRN